MLDTGLFVISLVLTLAMILGAYRLLRGPSAADRVIALDMIASLAIGLCAIFAMTARESHLMDVAAILALVAFLASVSLAAMIRRLPDERGGTQSGEFSAPVAHAEAARAKPSRDGGQP